LYDTIFRLISVLGAQRQIHSLIADDFSKLKEWYYSAGGKWKRGDGKQVTKNAWSHRTVGNEIGRVKMIFKFGVDNNHIDKLPTYGQKFKKPSLKTLRLERNEKPKKLFTKKQLKILVDKASQPLKAMILLGLNGGVGNSDVARLEYKHVDFASGWIDYPRYKTGVARKFYMWPETKKALLEAIEQRPVGGVSKQIFCTVKGNSFYKERADSPISKEFRKLLNECDMHVPGNGFYCLRHCFETFASDSSSDQVAINFCMGHEGDPMAAIYRESVDDKRLKKICKAVRRKALGKPKKKKQ